MKYKPHFMAEIDPSKPKRKSMVAPHDNGTFVKPIKQCFIKNPRLMPMTRIMLTLLAGWAGQGTAIETTTGIIGKHLSRCRRQVFRYLQDAVEEGYLGYSKTKDRIGRITGIKIWLNFGAIKFRTQKQAANQGQSMETRPKAVKNLAVTQKAETNCKHLYNIKEDEELWSKLAKLATTMGYIEGYSTSS
ncbi:MAG: hypothetical protein AAFO07_04880 [Bacteroidota bacterium]